MYHFSASVGRAYHYSGWAVHNTVQHIQQPCKIEFVIFLEPWVACQSGRWACCCIRLWAGIVQENRCNFVDCWFPAGWHRFLFCTAQNNVTCCIHVFLFTNNEAESNVSAGFCSLSLHFLIIKPAFAKVHKREGGEEGHVDTCAKYVKVGVLLLTITKMDFLKGSLEFLLCPATL